MANGPVPLFGDNPPNQDMGPPTEPFDSAMGPNQDMGLDQEMGPNQDMGPGMEEMQSHMDDAAAHAPNQDMGPGMDEPMPGDMDGDGMMPPSPDEPSDDGLA